MTALDFLILILCALLVWTGWHDIKTMTIPNWVSMVVIALFIPVAFLIDMSWPMPAWHLLSAVIAFIIAFMAFIPGLMGGGDVKLLTALGLWMRPQNLVFFLMLVAVIGGIISLFVIMRAIAKGKHKGEGGFRGILKQKSPYGPAIVIAGLLFFLPQLSFLGAA